MTVWNISIINYKNRDRDVVMLNETKSFIWWITRIYFAIMWMLSTRSRAEVFVRGTEIADNLTIAWNVNGHYFLHNFSLIIHYASRLWKNVNFPQASLFYLSACSRSMSEPVGSSTSSITFTLKPVSTLSISRRIISHWSLTTVLYNKNILQDENVLTADTYQWSTGKINEENLHF